MTFRLPHPFVLLLSAVVVAAALTWVLPAGEYQRRDDPATGRSVVVAGTYHHVERAPVGPFATLVAVPRGFVDAADVVAVVLFVGGAWVVVDRIGTLVGWSSRWSLDLPAPRPVAIPVVSLVLCRAWARSRTCRRRSSRSCLSCCCSGAAWASTRFPSSR